MTKFRELTNFPILLAPMVGLSHVALRAAIKKYYPQDVSIIWPTEMLNSRRLPGQELGATNETFKIEGEENLCPQILGNQEKYIKQSVEKLEQWGAKAIDINLGCPVKKALKHNYGVSLMGDIEYAKNVVAMTTRNTSLPISVKLRSGHQNDLNFLLEFCQSLESAGASWICLHPRLAQQKRQGNADWSQIKFLSDNLNIPVIGNGDIQIADDITHMFSQTSCAGVMIGRALTARPWMITQWAHKEGFQISQEQEKYLSPDAHSEAKLYGDFLSDFITECFKWFDDKAARKRILFMNRVGSVWLNFGHELTKKIQKSESRDGMLEIVKHFFENESLKFSERTNLRY